MRKPKLPLTGGCKCGAIRYELTAPPRMLYACHCTDCQRQSGSAMTVNMTVPAAAFAITRGTPKGWRRPNAAESYSTNWFCGDCGGRIYGSREDRPTRHTVRAGTLDDTSWLEPAAHFYVRSAQPWERFDGAAQTFEAMPEDFPALAAEWAKAWAAADE